jgi:UDP-N-acetylglucosamine--N-acetylmuramyl-(pentapeptide) pyrophosphoryl-undecaprenol N-acetylglucosamine transferase
MKTLRPHIVVGTGGYVAWPVLRAATAKGIPTVIQEQNSYPGIATRKLARRARKVYLGFKDAARHLATTGEVLVTGNPVRKAIGTVDRADALGEFGLDPGKRTLLICGGSQGARTINEAVMKSLEGRTLPGHIQLLWQTGKRDYREVAASVGDRVSRRALFPFAENMEYVYAAADLAVARAGALTLAELQASSVPAILVPYPHAAGDHQRRNAQAFVAAGAAELLADSELTDVDILDRAVTLLDSPRLDEMKQAMKLMLGEAGPAVDIIAQDIIGLIRERMEGERKVA